MSRIRSIHPGLWTDEAFVEMTPLARLFMLGLWNECDDMGSFSWSPLRLKMRILPADSADAGELLEEAITAGSLLRYEIDGKPYGAVRNFCLYQRPKKANSVHPQTDAVRKWVNLAARITRDGGEQGGKELPTNGGKSRQMEDGGDKGRVGSEEKSSKPTPPWKIPEGLNPQVWKDLLDNRKRKRLGQTETAWKQFQRELAAMAENLTMHPNELIERITAKGWGAVYDPTQSRSPNNGTSGNDHPLGKTGAAVEAVLRSPSGIDY